MEVKRIELDEWAEGLPSSGFEPFHLPDALMVLDDHAPGELQLYGGFKGDQLIAMAPLFVRENAVGRAVFSPPPSMSIPRLGPLVMPNSPKQRSQEKIYDRFAEGLLDAVGVDSSRTLFRMICGPSFEDPRPFHWRDLDVESTFTYQLDVGGRDADDVLSSFSSGLRRDIRKGQDLDVTVEQGGEEAARTAYRLVADRYAEQDMDSPVTWPFVRDLVRELDDYVRVYVAKDPEGAILNALVVLYSNDAAYYWQGGTADSYEGVSTNSLIQWQVIEDLIDDPPVDSVDRYDLNGANTKHLCKYKSGFGGDLVQYYTIESSSTTMNVAKRAYQMVGD